MSFEIIGRETEWYVGSDVDPRETKPGWSILYQSETEGYEDVRDDGWMVNARMNESKEEKQKMKKTIKNRLLSAWMNAKYSQFCFHSIISQKQYK